MENSFENKLTLLSRGDQRLSSTSDDIKNLLDPEFQGFIDSLIQCGLDHEGVGIAAPQVGKSIRLFIMSPSPNSRYPEAPTLPPVAIINPVILKVSEAMEKAYEGCLSVPGFRGLVPRHTAIDVAYVDRFGQKHVEHFSGFLARIFQHEYDHLDGILFPSRMIDHDPLLSLDEYTLLTGVVVKREKEGI